MILRLTPLPKTLLGPNTPDYRGQVPTRARFLAPDAWASLSKILDQLDNQIVFTDIFRSASASLEAHQTKSGTQPPGWSTHGYGLAVDVDLDSTLKNLKCSYMSFCIWMEAANWFCYRRDGNPTASEAWHFTYLSDPTRIGLTDAGGQWAAPGEAEIESRYGSQFQLSPDEVDAALKMLNLPDVKSFQTTWALDVDGVAGPKTQRLLAFVTAKIGLE